MTVTVIVLFDKSMFMEGGYEFYFQKQKRKVCNDTTFCNFGSMLLDNCTVNNCTNLICKGVYYSSQYSRNDKNQTLLSC